MSNTNNLDHVPASVAGGIGGAIASVGQFVGSNSFDECLGNFLSGAFILGCKAMTPFLVALFLMSICGAAIAYFLQAKTQNRWALFLAGAAATSIGTTALPGIKNLIKRVDIAPISVAYAADENKCSVQTSKDFGTALKDFFGLSDSGYRVIIASVKKPSEADDIIKRINISDPSLRVSVGDPAPCNEYYPVVVGPTTNSFSEAQQLQTKVQKLDGGSNAYISYRSR